MNHQDLITACKEDWELYTQHPFVVQLGQGTLDKACFQHYLQQDYLYLIHYARAFALAVFKSENPAQMRASMPTLGALVEHEITMHMEYCSEWGLDEAALLAIPEGVATVAYTRYLIDAGLQGNLTDLYAALVPCALGYAHVGQFLTQGDNWVKENNPYSSWVEMYAGEEYQQAAHATTVFLDELLAEIPADSDRARQLKQHFTTATRMEIAFWQQGLDLSR